MVSGTMSEAGGILPSQIEGLMLERNVESGEQGGRTACPDLPLSCRRPCSKMHSMCRCFAGESLPEKALPVSGSRLFLSLQLSCDPDPLLPL